MKRLKRVVYSNNIIESGLESFVSNALSDRHFDSDVLFDNHIASAVFDYLDMTRKPFTEQDIKFLDRLGYSPRDFYDMLDPQFARILGID